MSIELARGNLTLKQHGIAVLKRSRGVRLAVMRGTAWLTIDGETRDIVLNAGEVYAVESNADVAISAIAGPVEISVRTQLTTMATETKGMSRLIRTWARIRGALAESGHAVAGVV